ncbi:MAG: hypothetical protein WCD08_12095 [Steroidobacteraceae bacterium]
MRRERRLAAVVGLVLAAAGFALYFQSKHGSWRTPFAAAATTTATLDDSTGSETIQGLLQATQQHPDQIQAWLRLGSGYLRANQWPLARRSFRRADTLAGGRSAEALVGLAQTMEYENDGVETDEALALFERAVQLDPLSPPALFYSAVALTRAGKLAPARERFAAMLALDLPAGVSAALNKQVASLDAALAGDSKNASANAATTLHLTIDLSPELQGRVRSGAALFVFVRSPQGGAPLAAKRLQAIFPQQVELSAADAVIAGNSFKAGQKIVVVARISMTGAPTAGAGDLHGQLEAIAGQTKRLRLVVDKTG